MLKYAFKNSAMNRYQAGRRENESFFTKKFCNISRHLIGFFGAIGFNFSVLSAFIIGPD